LAADLTGRYAELATLLRDALYRLDDADVAELTERMNLSQEDISGMLRWLSFDAARARARRIWTPDPPPPMPGPADEKSGLWGVQDGTVPSVAIAPSARMATRLLDR
jgi:hypothetical protein